VNASPSIFLTVSILHGTCTLQVVIVVIIIIITIIIMPAEILHCYRDSKGGIGGSNQRSKGKKVRVEWACVCGWVAVMFQRPGHQS
jgi:hypothetical protein